ncbi:gamma-aminobutyric acid type B receptor subunit 2-like [Asterias amurensis]|uniref:gamma-aminobutyric acid type B receptor subunit 2-like n=1 Tax=Asterias amurensis TaxID=7602 RepID=UPI003AB112C6
MNFAVFLLTALCGFLSPRKLESARIDLHIAGLFPLTAPGWIGDYGLQGLTAVQLAVDQINDRADVLKDYRLVLDYNDTKASSAVGMTALFDLYYSQPVKIAVIGELLSTVTRDLTGVTSLWALTQMAFASSAVELSQRSMYPYFFRTIASADEFSPVQLEMFRQFGWSKISTLHETREPHAGVTNKLQKILEADPNFSIIAAESFNEDPMEAAQRLKDKDVRIIVGNFYESTARKVFCAAFRLGLYGPKYQWILIGYYTPRWWGKGSPSEHFGCNSSQIRESAEGYMTVTWSMNGRENATTVTGQTPQEFRDYIHDVTNLTIGLDGQDVAANAHDGMWALALGLNSSMDELAPKRLESYVYGDVEVAAIFEKHIGRVQFNGVSGPVSFSERGDRIGLFLIEQNRDGDEVVIGTYEKNTNITWLIETEKIWYQSAGRPPFDSDNTVTIQLNQVIEPGVFMTSCIIAGLGCILAICFVVFNFIKRKHREVKMSSPRLNNVVAAGLVLAYAGVIVMGIDEAIVSGEQHLLNICKAREWLLSISFTLAFGGMFTKMWRVYSIVIHNKTKKKVIKDHHLMAIVCVLLLVDLVILVPREIIDPQRIDVVIKMVPQTPEDEAKYRRYEEVFIQCTSTYHVIWLMALLIYKAFVMVFGAFLAWQTRNINVSGLNDSNYVGLSIYNVCMCCVVVVPVSIMVTDAVSVTYALLAGFIMFCTTGTLSMLFFPKVAAVLTKRNNIAPSTDRTQATTANNSTAVSTDGRGPRGGNSQFITNK